MIFFITALCAAFLAGISWFVQIVHYPLMKEIGKKRFMMYMYEHQMKTAYVVAPVMAVEVISALWFFVQYSSWFSFISLIFVGGVWAVTLGFSIPQHRILLAGFNHKAFETLSNTNWIRVGLWTARSVLLVVYGVLFYVYKIIQ